LNGRGELLWSDAYDEATREYPAIGDFDGDGQIDAIFVGFADGTRCYNARNGHVRWALPLGKDAAAPAAISGDILGNGRDQAIVHCDGLLQCISETVANSAHIEWSVKVPDLTSRPIVAVLAGDADEKSRKLSILYMDADGWLNCLQ